VIFTFAICACAGFADDGSIDIVSGSDSDGLKDDSCAYASTLNQIVNANMLIKIVDTTGIEIMCFTTVTLSKKQLYQLWKIFQGSVKNYLLSVEII
jgi:hypothetical protein